MITTDKDQCRAAFEACCKLPLDRAGHKVGKEAGPYLEHDTRWAWQSWVDCWAHQSAALAALGRQAGHDAAHAVHYRKKYEQAQSALAARDAEIARLRDLLQETVDQLSMAMAYMSDYLSEKEGMPETVDKARAALSQPSAQEDK